jgi:hypothetical protein
MSHEPATLFLESLGATIEVGEDKSLGGIVRSLRRKVFCEEEGYLEDMVETTLDGQGTHIVVRNGADPIACVSVIPPEHASGFAKEVCLPEAYIGRAALITKMAVVPEYRKSRLATIMVACLEYYIFGPREYRYAFVVLKGRHRLNEPFYQRLTGAERVAKGRCSYGEQVVLIMDRQAPTYQNVKRDILDAQIKTIALKK